MPKAAPRAEPLSPALRRIHAAALKLFVETGATRVNVSELAAAADMARGTIYSNVPDLDSLFEDVAAQLASDMVQRVMLGFEGIADPAQRMAIGIRQYIRRAHDEPQWGRFMSRFGLSLALLQTIWASDPVVNMQEGIASGRYKVTPEQLPAMVGLISGSTLAAMVPVLDGHATWRDIASDTAELLLVALGIARREARTLARNPLPPLVGSPT